MRSSSDLCAACLIRAAISLDDEPCPYRILAPIAESATSATYLAQALRDTHGYVALKVYDRRDDADLVLARYETWKDMLAAFRHPGVAAFVEAGLTSEGLLYVATDYVAGSPLTSRRVREGLSVTERQALAGQLTDAVAAIHDAGLAHLALDASRVKIATHRVHATILGLGRALVIDGLAPDPDADRTALAALRHTLLP